MWQKPVCPPSCRVLLFSNFPSVAQFIIKPLLSSFFQPGSSIRQCFVREGLQCFGVFLWIHQLLYVTLIYLTYRYFNHLLDAKVSLCLTPISLSVRPSHYLMLLLLCFVPRISHAAVLHRFHRLHRYHRFHRLHRFHRFHRLHKYHSFHRLHKCQFSQITQILQTSQISLKRYNQSQINPRDLICTWLLNSEAVIEMFRASSTRFLV